MADNTKIWPIFRWANWGLSDDLFTGIRNSFYYSNDMEIRDDAKSIFPKPVPAYADNSKWLNIWDGGTYEHNVINVTNSSLDGWWLVCTERNIYLVASWTVTLLCTMPINICDLEIFNWYIYVSTTAYLYYKKDNWGNWSDMAGSTNATAQNYGRCDETLTSNNYHPLYASDTVLCIWDTNRMLKVSRETYNLVEEWFKLQKWYYIRFITELWWFIRAVAVDEPYGSEVLLWDKISDAPTEAIPLEWYSIIQAAIYNWYLYLLSNKGLGLLNWYQYYLMKKVEWTVDTTTKNW
jgi:hypothetical protein